MATTPTPPSDADVPDGVTGSVRHAAGTADETVDALALVRRIRDDFAARTVGLSADERLALIRREAAVLEPAFDRPSGERAAA